MSFKHQVPLVSTMAVPTESLSNLKPTKHIYHFTKNSQKELKVFHSLRLQPDANNNSNVRRIIQFTTCKGGRGIMYSPDFKSSMEKNTFSDNLGIPNPYVISKAKAIPTPSHRKYKS